MANIPSSLLPLKNYLPVGTFPDVAQYLIEYRVQLTISRARSSILGNYSRRMNSQHKISVNGNLNRYSFLITLLHELAHLLAFEKYGARILSHGPEWKRQYSELLSVFTGRGFFPADVEAELIKTMTSPSASSCAEDNLMRVLRKYDAPKPGVVLLEELPHGARFITREGRTFRKGKKMRKRYLCENLQNGRMYSFSPIAEVKKIETSNA